MADEPTNTNEASSGAGAAADPKRKKLVKGAAIGIGSAAIVAALLYANRGRKGSDKG